MSDVLIVNPPSPDGHIYIRDVCRWGRKSREGMLWPQTSLAYLAAMVPENMTVRIIDAIAEGLGENLDPAALRSRAVAAYAKWQRLTPRQAGSVFAKRPAR